MKNKFFFTILFIMMLSFSGYAQITTSSISGVVYDDTNAALPAATVVDIHTPTGTKYGSTTNFDGIVDIRNMRVGGPYTITISYVGYKTEELTGVFLTLGASFDFVSTLQQDTQELQEVVITTSGDNTFSKGRTCLLYTSDAADEYQRV